MRRGSLLAGQARIRGLRGIAIVACCIALACQTVPRLQDEPFPIRVLVYNIHAGTDALGAVNLDRVAALIVETRADIVLLQEVDRGTERAGGVDQLAELERRTGLRGVFGKTLDYQGGDYGIATLSRWPIVRDTLIRLRVAPPQERAGGSYEPRGLLHAVIATPAGVLHALNTHLDPSRTELYRRQEIAQVLLTANRLIGGSEVVLLGGDLNAEPRSEVYEAVVQSPLTDAWDECEEEAPGLTFPASEPVKRIDYLFLSPTIACEEAEVVDTEASDHRPLLYALEALFYVPTTVPVRQGIQADTIPRVP